MCICGASQVAQWYRVSLQAGEAGCILALGRSPGGGNGNPFQYFCLENSMDRGAGWATIHAITKESDMT